MKSIKLILEKGNGEIEAKINREIEREKQNCGAVKF